METMQQIYNEMSKTNIIDNKKFLKKFLDIYKGSYRPTATMSALSGKKTSRNSAFYDALTVVDNNFSDSSKVNVDDYKEFYIKMTNDWISNILSLNEQQLSNLAKSGLDGYIKIKNVLKEHQHINSMEEISNLYNKISSALGDEFAIEKQYYFWRKTQDSYGFNANGDYVGTFTHVNSRYGKARQEKQEDVEYRLYINCANQDLFKIANAYVDYCKQNGMHYYFKYQLNSTRQDKFLIYSSKEQLSKNIMILKQIAKDYPEIVSRCGSNGELVGSIDNWIGLASEPDQKSMTHKHSFNTLRAEILEDAAERVMLDYIKKNKSRPEIQRIIVNKATDIVLEEMKKKNPQLNFTSEYIYNLKKFLASKNTDLNAIPVLLGFKCLEEVMPKKNELFATNSNAIFNIEDPEGKKFDYSIKVADKILKSLVEIMEKDNLNYLEDYKEEIKKRCQKYAVDPNNFALNSSSLNDFKQSDNLQTNLLSENNKTSKIDYSSMNHAKWDAYFNNMTSKELEDALTNEELLTALINEDVSKSYPSINSLLHAVRKYNIHPSTFELFTNGWVGQALEKRLSEGNWDRNDERKFELLSVLPKNVNYVVGHPAYGKILANVSPITVRSICLNVDENTKEMMSTNLNEEHKKAVEKVQFEQSKLNQFQQYLNSLRNDPSKIEEYFQESRKETLYIESLEKAWSDVDRIRRNMETVKANSQTLANEKNEDPLAQEKQTIKQPAVSQEAIDTSKQIQDLKDVRQKLLNTLVSNDKESTTSVNQSDVMAKDIVLDNYVMLEQSINQNPNLNEEQKQQARQQLWNDFDRHVEQSSNQTSRKR